MYRRFLVEVSAGVDSSLTPPLLGPVRAVLEQNLDRESFSCVKRIETSDGEAQVAIAPVTIGYAFAIFSDYPVKVRLNGSGATQFTLHSNKTAAVNPTSPLPYNCFAAGTCEITSIYLAPISGATRAANVLVYVSGDPASAYT